MSPNPYEPQNYQSVSELERPVVTRPQSGAVKDSGLIIPVTREFAELLEPSTAPAPATVPEGSSTLILSWAGGDAERARAAIDAELRRERPRSSLISRLERIAGAAG